MRIGIDARLYSQSGIGRYIKNLLIHLQKIDKKNEYVVFLMDEDFKEVSLKNNFKKVRANITWYGVSEQIKMPKLLNKYNLDLVHFPHFNIPVFYNGKFIITIHDLIHQHFRMKRATTRGPLIYRIKQAAYKYTFSLALKKSLKIITVSDYVKGEIKTNWRIKDEKIAITKEAVEEEMIELIRSIKKKDIDKTLNKFGVKAPFIFYVGNAHPHKNIERLIKTFLRLRKKYQYLKLVLAGNDHYFWQRIRDEFKDPDIVYTGFISDKELVVFYKSATCFVMPSLEEGFGIPLLEAFACGVPVVSSKRASLPEVGGEACLYFDPTNLDDMEEKISEVLNNNGLRRKLVEGGMRRYKQFSWRELANETLEIYENV